MNGEGITSLAVVDNQFNVVGNISTADVKVRIIPGCGLHCSQETASDAVLVAASATQHMHAFCFSHSINAGLGGWKGFVSGFPCQPDVDARAHGSQGGGHQVASVGQCTAWRAQADRSRLWVTDPHSPSSSGPPTPSHSTVHIPQPTVAGQSSANQGTNSRSSSPPVNATNPQANYTSPHLPSPPQSYANTMPHCHAGPSPGLAPSVPASSLPGARLSGRLVGVVSLTDILNLHARASGLNPADPAESRSRRRRSSSSSVSVRRSGDVGQMLSGRSGFYA